MRSLRALPLLVSLTTTTLLITACVPKAPEEQPPVNIGYLGPLTGEAASYGIDTLNGVKLAVEDINAAGGINGRRVELIAEDAQCTGADAASAAQKLVNVDKVVAIMGGQCSGETLAAAPIVEAGKIPMISPVSSSPDVTQAGEFVFRVYPSDALKTKAMAKYLQEQKYTKLAMISENTDFATAFRKAITEQLEEGVIVFDELVEPNTKDFRTLMARLQDIDFDIFFPNSQSDAVMAAMLQQLREAGLTQQAITHDVGDSVTLLEIAPEASSGLLVINVPTSGQGTDFETRFTGKFGPAQSTIAFAAHAYDGMSILAEAIRLVGTEGPALRDALYAMPGYAGLVGTISFDEHGDAVGIPYVLKRFQNGAIETIGDIEVD
jgi:branched-chain amino acid transport system substrate-binding protein